MSNPLSGIAKKIADEKNRMAAELRKQEEEKIENEANRILTGLEEKVIEAVRQHKTELYVMECSGSSTDPSKLIGAARLVYDACLEAQLGPFLKTRQEKIPLNDDYNEYVQVYIKLT